MRKIKFRAWDTTSKAMYDLNAVEDYPFSYIAKGDTPYTKFMQFTGLKDKNGKEIYEGDVLKVPDLYELPENTSMTYNYQAVTFENCSFYLADIPMHEDYEYISEECEVIGNIYENPDLLKD